MDKRIAILTVTHFAHGRDVVRGLLRYGNEHHPEWLFQVVWRTVGEPDFHRRLAPFDVVVNAWSDDDVPLIPVPSVRVTSDSMACPGCVVNIDELAVGRLAVAHLVERRVKSLVSVRRPHLKVSTRIDAFDTAAGRTGLPSLSFSYRDGGVFEELEQPPEAALSRLLSLPKPIGLFADTDGVALTVLHSLPHLKLKVPDDVLLLGVDNDQFICDLARPALSSIAMPFERAGYVGGEMIDRFFETGVMPPSPPLIAPLGIVTRGSTRRMALEDRVVADAMRFIQQRAPRQGVLHVTEVADHVAVSNRTLQTRFQRTTGHTVIQEIARCRVARAQELLRDADLALKDVARKSGFSSVSKFCDVFRRVTGTTPARFRRSGL